MLSKAKRAAPVPLFLRMVLILLMALAALCATGPPALAQDAPAIHINGAAFYNDTPPFLHLPGYNYASVRDLSEALGFKCEYFGEEQLVVLSKPGFSLTVKIGSDEMLLNGQKMLASVPSVFYNSRVYVGLRALAEALGATVGWDGETNSVTILTDYETKISAPAPLPLAGRTIILDPGHGEILANGAINPGAVGASGLLERAVVLNVANYTAELLRAQGATVIVTRGASTGLTLSQRAQMATTYKADLLVSIHANANVNRSIKGTAMYVNQVSPNAKEDARLAACIQQGLVAHLGTKNLGLFTGSYAIVRNLPCPGVIAEIAFLSNPDEEKLLATADYQKKAAAGIAAGIIEYLR
ncbi:MAG: N-acetylmuramoyl-L-alanine amidase [Clostridiales bacterium]|nr:N-acetylmuramoyl-L-alanine amidase [Clostridiales bacterium]